ncbi:MAG: hypothetical protein AAGE84_05145 [Cyanobacteria bacterium P01_G01_bin.39]
MTNPSIETDIAEILKDLQKGQKDILISLETIKGDIKALDTKVEQLDKRIGNQEFLNRGIFIGLLLALLSGLVNYFGWMPKG